MKNKVKHPGEFLKEILDESNLDVRRFAKKCGLHSSIISLILEKRIDVDESVAQLLSEHTNIDKNSWLCIQKLYDEKQEVEHFKNSLK